MSSIDDKILHKIYPEKESGLEKIAKVPLFPIKGVKDWASDTIKLAKEARGEHKSFPSLLKYYAANAASGLASLFAIRSVQYGLAKASGASLGAVQPFAYPLSPLGFEYYAGSPSSLFFSTVPVYFIPTAMGIYTMLKGAQNKNMYQFAAGAGATAPVLIDGLGPLRVAAEGIYSALGYSGAGLLPAIAGGLLLGGTIYGLSKMMVKWYINRKQHKQAHNEAGHNEHYSPNAITGKAA